MKRLLLSAIILASLLLVSCSSTSDMVKGIAVDQSLSIPEKLEAAGFEKVSLSRPEVFFDGQQWKQEFLEMVEGAQKYIIISVFLGSQCEEDQDIIDALEAKAESGIPVYLVYDGTGTFDMTESRYHLRPLSDMKKSGVHLLEYHPFSYTRLVNLWNVVQREHRKFVVVDGNQIAIGGMNLNYISLGPLDSGGQRDSMYRFQSADLGAVLVKDFIDFWNNESWDEVDPYVFPPAQKSDEENLSAYCADQYGDRMCMSTLFGILVNSAQQSVQSLPFLPYSDSNMLSMLSSASERGVDFSMIVPFDSRPMPKKATSYMLSDLVRTGVNVCMENQGEEPKALLHEKLMIVDGTWVCFGSSNFNYRSMNLSNEIMLVMDDPELVTELSDHFKQLEDDTYVLTQDEADSMKKLKNLPNFVFGFFGG